MAATGEPGDHCTIEERNLEVQLQVEAELRVCADRLREWGDPGGAKYVEEHGLGAVNGGTHILHNIYWTPNFETIVLVPPAIRNLLPERYAPPHVMLPREDPPLRIAPVEGRGWGLFATRALPPGVPILVEPPSLVLPILMFERPFKALFERAVPPQRAKLYTLYNCKPPWMCDVEEGIVRTNAIGIAMRVPKDQAAVTLHRGVFQDLSRANHSCSPNIAYDWDLDSFTMTVYTLREVKEGEELTITYVDRFMSAAQRQARLKEMYLFDCACEACAKQGDARAMSDKRRAEIVKLAQTLDVDAFYKRWATLVETGWDRAVAEREILKPLKRAYGLFVKEGLERCDLQSNYASALMRFYAALRDGDAEALWAKRAAQSYMVWYWMDKARRPEILEQVRLRKEVVDRAAKRRVSQ